MTLVLFVAHLLMIFIAKSFFYVVEGGGFEFTEPVGCNIDEVGEWW
jgi:hypothetical protein